MAIGGPHCGSTTRRKMRHSPAPSMRAASISASGTPMMNCRMRNTPSGPARNGRMSAGYVLTRPMFATRTNIGTSVTTPGTIKVSSTRPNSTFLPGNSSFASAYATIEQNTMLPTTTTSATTTEFRKNCP